jgi:hypothetical protein
MRVKEGVMRIFLLFLMLSTTALWSANPDFTQGGKVPSGADHDWNLGPTGARGWIYSHKLSTSEARQILVTKVEEGSPAAKKLKVGDVILGIGKAKFNSDPRKALGMAIGQAEASGGRLALLCWRKGKIATMTIQLKVLGQYRATAPSKCGKSGKIFKLGCEQIARNLKKSTKRSNWIVRSANALALLASGDRKYLSLIKKEVKAASEYSGIKSGGHYCWYYGPVNILLAEYTLATRDRRYLPALKRITMEIVNGQSAVGSWGHKFINEKGRLRGYGMMNAPGAPMTLSLVLAKMAGVRDSKLDVAIKKSTDLLRFYVGKGSVPYGDHDPWTQTHDDNGKNGVAAVLFNLLGDSAAATYFSKMSIASHGDEREMGHTGNFFNIQWALPSVALSGYNATGAWLKEYGWYYDMGRRWDGTFIHQGAAEEKNDSYRNWDSTGVYMLAYAQAARKLYITGRKVGVVKPIAALDAEKLLAAGRHWKLANKDSIYKKESDSKVLELLKSWSPTVRERAGVEVSRRRSISMQPIIEMLKSTDLYSQLGACEAIINMRGRAASAVPLLDKTLDHQDLWLRMKAAAALAAIGKPAMKTVPKLLKMFSDRNVKEDPRSMQQRYLSFALFNSRGGLLSRSLAGVDQEELLTAVKIGLKNDDGRARGAMSSVYKNLKFNDLKPLLPAIYEAIVEPSPSGIMFADTIRTAGLTLFSKHLISEGLELTVDYMKNQKAHASEHRIKDLIKLVEPYGAHAKRVIPQLEKVIYYFEKEEKDFPKRLSLEKAAAVKGLIAKIKGQTKKPTLLYLKK